MAETKSKRDEISHLSSLNVNSIETVNDGVTSETIQPTPIFDFFLFVVCCRLGFLLESVRFCCLGISIGDVTSQFDCAEKRDWITVREGENESPRRHIRAKIREKKLKVNRRKFE